MNKYNFWGGVGGSLFAVGGVQLVNRWLDIDPTAWDSIVSMAIGLILVVVMAILEVRKEQSNE